MRSTRESLDAIRAGQFKQEMEWGETLAKDAFRDYSRLRTAEIRGDLGAEELTALRMQVRQKMAAVSHSMTAKSYLKYKAPPRMGRAYTEVHDEILDDAVRAFNWEMKNMGYNEQTLTQFRNKSSMDPGMDADIGLVEKSYITQAEGPDGQKFLVENPWLTRHGEKVSLRQYQADASPVMAAAYKKVSGGYGAKQSFVDFTTSIGRESYLDKTWLNLPKAGPHSDLPAVQKQLDGFFGKIDPDLTPQALGVTPTKAEIMFREHPELRPLGSMMETCRGAAKDLDTKFIPLVDSKIRQLEGLPEGKRTPDLLRKLGELRDTRQYLQQCRDCMSDIGKGATHPARWVQDFRMITGGEDPVAVTRRLAKMTLDADKI